MHSVLITVPICKLQKFCLSHVIYKIITWKAKKMINLFSQCLSVIKGELMVNGFLYSISLFKLNSIILLVSIN